MAQFLTTAATVAAIEHLIRAAKRDVLLISPYLQLSGRFTERLSEADQRGVRTTFVYGKTDLHEREVAQIAQLQHSELRYYEHLHAKCYVGERSLVLTSMNLYAASERNREMGVLLDMKRDKVAFAEARQEAYAIRDLAEEKTLIALESGFCVRCRKEIDHNPESPYCYGCWQTWARFGNPYYEERACHGCGQDYATTMEKPLCQACYYGEAIPTATKKADVRAPAPPERLWKQLVNGLTRGQA